MSGMSEINETINYCRLQDRLETYKKWPFKDSKACSAPKMAAAGFFQPNPMEEHDLAKCFVCKKELDGWEENDDPMKEHERHQNSCEFVLLGKEEKDITTEELMRLLEASAFRTVEKLHQKNLEKLDDQHEEYIKQLEKQWKKSKN